MSLQKKCLTASAVVHGLMVLLVFVGSAFIPQPPKPPGTEFEIVNIPLDALVEEPNVISGNPEAGRPPEIAPALPPAQPVQTPQTLPQTVTPPPQPQPDPPQQPKQVETRPDPVKTPPKPENNPEPNPFDISKAKVIKNTPKQPDNPQQNFDLNKARKQTIKTTPSQTTDNTARNDAERARQAAAQLSQALQGTRQALQNTGSRVGISYSDIIGPGGRAQMSYDMAVAKIYENVFQRHPVASAANDSPVIVEVVVQRDGTVSSERVVQSSGRAQINRAVRQTLNEVNKVMPFPSDFKSDSRTIRINFNPADF